MTTMKTVGQLLKETRESHHLTLTQVAHRTKIREDFLEAVEQDNFAILPKGPFIKGFLRAYALDLNLEPQYILAVYRRDFGKQNPMSHIPEGLLNPVRKHRWFVVSPRLAAVLFIIFVVGSFITFEWISFNQPPSLVVAEPNENTRLHSPVTVRGKTITDAVVTINGVPIALNQDGVFRTQLEFSPGNYSIVIEAKNRQGKTRVVQREVTVIE